MSKLLYNNVLFLLILLSSCGMKNTSKEKSIGGNKDRQGCLASAGYIWSQIKHSCIRPFEDGIALIHLNNNSSYTSATYLVLSNDQLEAEIFTPSIKNSILLKRDKNQSFKNGKYQLVKENAKWSLYIEKNKEFEQEK